MITKQLLMILLVILTIVLIGLLIYSLYLHKRGINTTKALQHYAKKNNLTYRDWYPYPNLDDIKAEFVNQNHDLILKYFNREDRERLYKEYLREV